MVVRSDNDREHAASKAIRERRPDLPIRFIIGQRENVGQFENPGRCEILGWCENEHSDLAAADLVFTDHSQMGKLAIFHRKPLITVNFSGEAFAYNRFDEEGVALLASKAAELRRATHRLLDSAVARAKLAESYPAYVRRHFTSNDGHAADRVADLLLGTHGPHWPTDGAASNMRSRPSERGIAPNNPTYPLSR